MLIRKVEVLTKLRGDIMDINEVLDGMSLEGLEAKGKQRKGYVISIQRNIDRNCPDMHMIHMSIRSKRDWCNLEGIHILLKGSDNFERRDVAMRLSKDKYENFALIYQIPSSVCISEIQLLRT